MGINFNQKGKSSSSSSSSSVKKKNKGKIFKNRFGGFEKKFNELRKLCDVKAVGVLHSEFIHGVKSLPADNPNEFNEIVMQLNKLKMKEAEKDKNQNFCSGNSNPKFDHLCTVESISGIERDLESLFHRISKRENLLKAGVSSASSSSLNCYQDDGFGVLESPSTLLAVRSYENLNDYGCSSSDFSNQLETQHDEMKNGVLESTYESSAIRSSKNLYDYGCSSSDFFKQQESQPLISLDPFSDDMVRDQPFSDMVELEYQRLNCSSSYMEMMMNLTTPGPEFLLC